MFSVGDGRLGFPADAPYKAIHVGAAAPTMPQAVSMISQISCLIFVNFTSQVKCAFK